MKILLIEDDAFISAALTKLLTANHYTIAVPANGQKGLKQAIANEYDLIVLDLQSPKLDGINLCRQLRSQGYHKPILLLTANDSNADIAAALDAGADDYVVKPYTSDELLVRIRALLRRSGATVSQPSTLSWGELCVDLTSGKVTLGEQVICLTATEYKLLELFLQNPNRIFSRSAILDQLWGVDKVSSERAIITHIKDIRKKLKAGGLTEDMIETVYGMGYRLQPHPKHTTSEFQACFQTSPSDSDSPVFREEERVGSKPVGDGKDKADKEESFFQTTTDDYTRENFLKVPLFKGNLGESQSFTTDTKTIATSADIRKKYTPSAEDIATANRVLARLRDSYQKQVALQVAVLEQAHTALLAGCLDDELKQAAMHEAHKLAGSMKTFGYPEGSKLGQTIEHLLMDNRALTPEEVSQFSQLVAALQQELNRIRN